MSNLSNRKSNQSQTSGRKKQASNVTISDKGDKPNKMAFINLVNGGAKLIGA